MHTVVKIAGCSGSGKSDIMRHVIDLAKLRPYVPSKSVKVEAYMGTYEGAHVTVLGSYVNQCGGMDGIQGKDIRIDLIRKYAGVPNSITFMEGLIVGKCYGEIGKISEEENQMGRWLYAWLDTPLEVCISRVMQRRVDKGNLKPFDPERTMLQNWKTSFSAYRRAGEAGHPQHLIDWRMSSKVAARKLLATALEMHNAPRKRVERVHKRTREN
jgi:hypothetical protein